MNQIKYSRESIPTILKSRLEAGKTCDVSSLREAGLGALYNAARNVFAAEWEQSGHVWENFIRLVLGPEVVPAATRIARHTAWTADLARERLRELYAAGQNLHPGEMLRDSEANGLYLWLTRNPDIRRQFTGWASFCCDVLGMAFPDEAWRFDGKPYDRDGTYLRPARVLTDTEREWLDGFLLGDGSIALDERNPARPNAHFRLTSKFASMAEFAMAMLPTLGGRVHERVDRLEYERHGVTRFADCQKAIYVSRCCPEMLAEEARWYEQPEDSKEPRRKFVPPISR